MPTITRAADLSVVGASGGGWTVDLGADTPAAPTDFTAPVAPWLPMGAISDDGLVYGFDEDSEQFTPWGLSSPFRTVVTQSIRTFGCTLWETNRRIVRSVMFRLPVADLAPDVDGIHSFAETSAPTPDRRAWLFHVYDGETMEGFFVPQGEISDRSDVTFKQDEMAGYEIEITAYPDDSGNTVYHFYAIDVASATSGAGS
jgi:hypothetical protein